MNEDLIHRGDAPRKEFAEKRRGFTAENAESAEKGKEERKRDRERERGRERRRSEKQQSSKAANEDGRSLLKFTPQPRTLTPEPMSDTPAETPPLGDLRVSAVKSV
jgi:hypothetical protein